MKNLAGTIGWVILASISSQPVMAGTDREAATAVNHFGVELYKGLRESTDGNLIISPLSIALALGMVLPGADEEGAGELLEALGWSDVAAANAGLGGLAAAMEARNETEGITLEIANRGFVHQDFRIDPAFIDTLTEWYGFGVEPVDFDEPETARAAINRWVAERTNELLEELLPEGSITELTRLVLVNAIYLLADWKHPFDQALTADEPFHLGDGGRIEVPTMHREFTVPVALGETWRAVELPYVDDELAVLIIVPDELSTFEQALNAEVLRAIVDDLAPRQVRLWLPKVETGSHASVKDALDALAVRRIFQPDDRLPGIAPELFVSDVIHETYLRMDEAGTEAAAATGVVIGLASLQPEPFNIRVDRPYFMALRDRTSGAILFLGRVVDPR